MRDYGWPRVFVRDGAVLFLAGAYILLATDNARDYPATYIPLQPPCSNAGWHEFLSFLLGLGLAIAFVECLNWVGWRLKRNLAKRSTSNMSPLEPNPLEGIDLLLPDGWLGLLLGTIFLWIAVYRLHGPNPCVPATYGSTPGGYLAGALTLAYALLALTQACFDLAWKFSRVRSN